MKNKKYLWDLQVEFLKDRNSTTEVPSKYVEALYCTTKEIENFERAIEMAILKCGGCVAEFLCKKMS